MTLAKQIQAISEILQELGGDLYIKAFQNKGIAALTIGQFRYLEVVARCPGITATELATLFGVTKPTVTQTTAVLDKRGLVTKKESADDRRSNNLYITRITREILAFRNGMYRRFADRIREILTGNQLQAYIHLNELILEKLVQENNRER